MKIVIVDYNCGNTKSISNAVEYLGYSSVISNRKQDILSCDRIILPGVGSFGQGMLHLKKYDLLHILRQAIVLEQRPTLGVCLGAQLLLDSSEECISEPGLGFVSGQVVRLKNKKNLRVPHMGWNKVSFLRSDENTGWLYFAHSFYMRLENRSEVTGQCKYGNTIDVSFKLDNICGCQFHPEKSQKDGILFLKNFLEKNET